MIVASVLSALGFLLTAAVTQTRGLRLGGTILVPTLVVYGLRDFTTLPIFIVSTVVAYGVLWVAKERTLVYGRDEFLVALAAGALLPVAGYLALRFLLPTVFEVNPLVFAGSILPGLAAYNLSQTKPGYRRQDLVYTLGLIAALLLLGAIAINPWTAAAIGGRTPLVLFAETSDIAVLTGSVVAGELPPNIELRTTVVAFFVVGMALSELVRRAFGIRVGIISMALLALFALVSRWLLVLFAVSFLVALVGMRLTHRATLLYGRVIISIGCAIGTVVVLALVPVLPVTRGFSALFVGVIAGVDAYAVHVTPPRERRQQPFLALAVFVGMLLLMRTVIDPLPRGVLQTYAWYHVVAGVAVVLLCLGLALRLRIPVPADEDVLSASVLSGGES